MVEMELQEAINQYEEPLHNLIHDLLTEYFLGGSEDLQTAARAIRRQRLVDRADFLESQEKHIQTTREQVMKELDILDKVVEDLDDDTLVDNALKQCATLSAEKRDPANDAVQNHAKKVGLPPQRFVELLNERYPLDKYGRPPKP